MLKSWFRHWAYIAHLTSGRVTLISWRFDRNDPVYDQQDLNLATAAPISRQVINHDYPIGLVRKTISTIQMMNKNKR